MKPFLKRFLLLAFLLYPLQPANPATDAKTADYLDRLNRYYYCLSREGLKSFQCSVSMSLSVVNPDGSETTKPIPYPLHLSYLGNGLDPVLSTAAPAASAEDDSLMQDLLPLLNIFLKTWGAFSTTPLFRPEMPQMTHTVSPLTDTGFTVRVDTTKESITVQLDRQALAQSILYQTKGESYKIMLAFTNSPKGPLLQRLATPEYGSGFVSWLDVDYEPVQGFQLPSVFIIHLRTAKGTLKAVLRLSDYQVHGAAGGTLAAGNDVRFIPAESEEPGTHHFFWRVRSATATVYVLGSIHIRPDIPLLLPEVVERGFNSSSYVGFEFDLTQLDSIRADIGKYMKDKAVYPPGDNLLKHLTSTQWASLRETLRQVGLSESVAVRIKPGPLSDFLQGLRFQKEGWDAEYGVDMNFLKMAKGAGKPVFGMEFWWEPLAAMDTIPPSDQSEILGAMNKTTDSMIRNVSIIYSQWRKGDTAGMESLTASNLSPVEKTVTDKLLRDRNIKWMGQFDRMLKTSATYFVVVGAAHLVGPNGVPALLQAKGYEVEQF